MQNEVSQIQKRQWTMLRAIPRAPQKITVTELVAILLAAGIEPSRRTVERELHELSLRYPLTLDNSGRPHGWSWMKDAAVEFMPRLTVPQSLALSLVQEHIRDLLPQTMLKDLAPVFAAADRELESSGWKDWKKLIAVAPPAFALLPPKIDAKVLSDVQHAIVRRLRMTAKYRSKGTEIPRKRDIHPLGLLVRGTVQYLVCLLPEHDGPRQLCLHRMSDTVVGTEPRMELPGFRMSHYAANDLAIDPRGKIRLRAIFLDTAAEHLQETPMSKDQAWHRIEGTNTVEICATVEDDLQFRRWLRSFGSELVVMEPAHLREEMMAELKGALGAYTV